MWTRRLFLALPLGRAEARAKTVFERKMISSGNNRPSLDLGADRRMDICAALHRRNSLRSIERELGIAPGELRRRLGVLSAEELVKAHHSGFLPGFMVVALEDAKWMAPPRSLIAETGRLIVEFLPAVRERVESMPGICRSGFSANAFLILSNVLLDNWQIRNVEKQSLNAERPLRKGGRYYLAIFEKSAVQRGEAFGIYGNAAGSMAGIGIGVYGNRRYAGNTLVSMSKEDFAQWFAVPPQEKPEAHALSLLERLVALARTGEDRLSDAQRDGCQKLGLLEDGVLKVAVFSRAEAESLGDVAALLTPALIRLLERERPRLEATFRRSPYKDEVTFNEFFMWWYHFFYTAVTDWLARQGVLEVPRSGNATYIITA